jgi:hypothetical protein
VLRENKNKYQTYNKNNGPAAVALVAQEADGMLEEAGA